MKSYRAFLALVVAAFLVMSSSIAVSSSGSRKLAAATIGNQFNGAVGVLGFVTFVDDGTSLHVTGTAINLDASATYFSLLYDKDSVPSGANACEPTPGSDFTQQQMVVGFWQPLTGSSTRTIDVVKTKTSLTPPAGPFASGDFYAPIGTFATMSIRKVVGPPPAGFVLQACGIVVAPVSS